MKKFIAVVLSLVMIFSFAVPSFAYQPGSSDDELEALNNIEYYTYWIWSDFTDKLEELKTWDYNSLQQLLDINDYSRSIYNEISSLRESLLGDTVWLRPFADTLLSSLNTIDSNVSVLYEDLHALREVLANDDDLAFKESQKENQEYIQDTFFNPGSSLSLDVSKLTDFTKQFTDFTDSFDFIDKVGTSTSPLDSISEGSEFSQWFTDETGKDMDPTFSSGGGGVTPEPDPEPEPEPDPDPPAPPETTSIPTLSYDESSFTVSAVGLGTVKLYVDSVEVSNPYTFTQTETAVTYVVTATAQETDKLISATARLDVTVPALEPEPDPPAPPETTSTPTLSYDESSFTVSAVGLGTVKLYVDSIEVPNPYTFTQTESSVTYVVTATAQETDKLISETARLDVTVPALEPEPEPEPLVNWLPLATSTMGGTQILGNGKGYLTKVNWAPGNNVLTYDVNSNLTGWIPSSVGDIVYLSGFNFSSSSTLYFVLSNGSVYETSDPKTFVADSNGVYTVELPSFALYFRFSFGGFTNGDSNAIITKNQYPLQNLNVANFSLKRPSSTFSFSAYEPEVVTSAYSDRMKEYFNMLGVGK